MVNEIKKQNIDHSVNYESLFTELKKLKKMETLKI